LSDGVFSAVGCKLRPSQNQQTVNAVASPAMIIDGGVCPAEHHLLDEIVGQEIMREAEFDFGGVVQLGQLFIR
jgi:hypothetical protein